MLNLYTQAEDARDLWRVADGDGMQKTPVTQSEAGFAAEDGRLSFSSVTEETAEGILVRRDEVKNLSTSPITLSAASLLFTLDGGEYQVYTQYNGWQNESMGAWQELITEVSLRAKSHRPCHSAAPFLALYSEQAKRGVAFHLLTSAAWEIRIAKERGLSDAALITLSFGLLEEGLALPLGAGESLALPTVLYYEFTDKTSLDSHKLHAYLNRIAPRRALPVVYNTWMYKFDHFTSEAVLSQVDKAASLGIEYFVIDAGWFGEGENWGDCRGDWEENQTFGFHGRMKEISDAVRAKGMGFGFWIEAETAAPGAKAPKEHPEYYIKSERAYHLDFANPAAVDYIFAVICGLIDRYEASYIKFDFNVDLFRDPRHAAFTAYHKGHDGFLLRLKEKYPHLYLENCASGGGNMWIGSGLVYDSFWTSDDQSPYDQMRIIKESSLRMPPSWLDRFVVARSAAALTPVYPKAELYDQLIACCDATWEHVEGIHPDYLSAFLAGGAPCFSCDLTAFTEAHFALLRDMVAEFKESRAFWTSAVCHLLTDTKTVTTMEYASPDYTRAEILLYTAKSMQRSATVYPVLSPSAHYRVLGKGVEAFTASGKTLMENGVRIPTFRPFDGYRLSFHKEN